MHLERVVVRLEQWPIAGEFRISRETRRIARVLVVELASGGMMGRGEAVPYPRYGETASECAQAVEGASAQLAAGAAPADCLPRGAARNAVDCALWDLRARLGRRSAADLLGVPAPSPCTSAFTLSVDDPEALYERACNRATWPVLKLKLDGQDDVARVAAVRRGAPLATLIVDANEAWSEAHYTEVTPRLADLGVALIEQPFPAAADNILEHLPHPVPVCADESVHDVSDLGVVARRYDAINVKLDKAGGLTAASELCRAARDRGIDIMVGCMVSTSLALAPAWLLTSFARYIDLDGSVLLARDRPGGVRVTGTRLCPPAPELWGNA